MAAVSGHPGGALAAVSLDGWEPNADNHVQPLSGADFARFIVKVADAEQVPRRALLGMGHAESKWRSDAPAHRSGPRRAPVADVSGGGFQQTVAFSDELEAKGLDWHTYPVRR